jgi:hypothetical protein
MGTASAPAPDGSHDSKGKVGPGEVFKAIDEISKWHGRWATVAWLVATLAPIGSAALVWLHDTSISYLHILGKTAPLTIGVILLVLIFRSFPMNLGVKVITMIAVLAASALISQLLGLGAPVNWDYRPAYFDSTGNYHSDSLPTGLLGILFGLLSAYFNLYHAGPFVASIATGLIAGFWLSGRART